jgi:hypothetical protein
MIDPLDGLSIKVKTRSELQTPDQENPLLKPKKGLEEGATPIYEAMSG